LDTWYDNPLWLVVGSIRSQPGSPHMAWPVTKISRHELKLVRESTKKVANGVSGGASDCSAFTVFLVLSASSHLFLNTETAMFVSKSSSRPEDCLSQNSGTGLAATCNLSAVVVRIESNARLVGVVERKKLQSGIRGYLSGCLTLKTSRRGMRVDVFQHVALEDFVSVRSSAL
jgi:hypothetical protein